VNPALGRAYDEDCDTAWYDEDAGALVRPYTVTGGRTRTGTCLDMILLVSALPGAASNATHLPPEQQAILAALHPKPLSVAEISAYLRLPLGTVWVLLEDLQATGLVRACDPLTPAGDEPSEELLMKLLDGLLALR
jgi:hypothetical protein